MNGKNDFALVPSPPSAVEKAQPGARRILSGMVADTLALTNREQLKPAGARFRIGEYQWREPDYRQILIWAKALGLTPEVVVERLLNDESLRQENKDCDFPGWAATRLADGKMLGIHWDLPLLPLESFEFVEGLCITTLSFYRPAFDLYFSDFASKRLRDFNGGDVPAGHSLRFPPDIAKLDLSRLPHLTRLACTGISIDKLDLSAIPHLTELHCSSNYLRELELSRVPQLAELSCSDNQIGELEVSALPELTHLDCSSNEITELDLSLTPKLTTLDCTFCQISKLNLSGTRNLKVLRCWGNRLAELDLSDSPKLVEIVCPANSLTKLDLSRVPELTDLWAWGNRFAELDLSNVPKLTSLCCRDSPIKVLDIRSCLHLTKLEYSADSTILVQRPDQHF